FGYDNSEGVDYGLVPILHPESTSSASSSFSTSGVSFVLHSQLLLFVLGGDAPAEFQVPGNGFNSFLAYFSVGDGSVANASAMESEVEGAAMGHLQGCVTIGGAPAPGARVAVGPLGTVTGQGTRIRTLRSHYVTDASG